VLEQLAASADKTWSAVAVDSHFDTLLTAVDQWSIALKNELGTNRKKYDRAFGAMEISGRHLRIRSCMIWPMRLTGLSAIRTSSQRVRR